MKGLIISDQHFGAVDGHRLIVEHEESLFLHMNSLVSLDFIFILGDYFDHKMYMNDYNAYAAIVVMQRILEYAKKFKSIVRIIYGTASHECGQYSMFQSLFDDSRIDIKVIEHVCDENVKGLDILYLPEEYIYDKKEYYKDTLYSGKKYNYIFGHGVIKEVMANACRNESKDKKILRKKVPYFTTAELKNACCGEVYFGHYHVHTVIQDNIHYVGSFSSWIFGEASSPKGFYMIDTDGYHNTFIKNTLARKFEDIYYQSHSDIYSDENVLLNELARIDTLISNGIYDMIKLHFELPEDFGNTQMFLNVVTNRYNNSENVKIDINTNGTNNENNDHIAIENNNEYSVIFDKNVPIDEKIRFYIKKDFDKDVDLQTIRECIHLTYDNN